MTAEEVKQSIRNVPDYPIKGIQFKDITTALAKPECLRWMRDEMVKRYKGLGITKVVGIESRGFIIAPAVAMEIGAGFVLIRKPGKLPAETIKVSYTKEYGSDTIEMHKGALDENDIVLIHDDILATGGTARGLAQGLNMQKVVIDGKTYPVKVKDFVFLVEIDDLPGRSKLEEIAPVKSLIHVTEG
jgi:adenine phosphoribosyltransferase